MKSASELLGMLALAAALACCRSAPDASSSASERPFRCATCHTPEYQSTVRPPHASARPETCGVCHTQSSWHHVRIEHPWWPLTGAHARAAADQKLAGVEQRVKCFWCHRGERPVFEGTPRECIGCHDEDRQDVKFPGHAQFSTACETCHSTEAWKPAKEPASTAPGLAEPASARQPKPVASAHPATPSRPAAAPTRRPTQVTTPSPVATPTPISIPAPAPTPTPAPTPIPIPTRAPAPTPVPDINSQASRRR